VTGKKFRKIEHTRVAQAVVDQFEQMILHGTLRDGEKLPSERELSEQLEVSRQTLREAFKTLEMHGLIEAKQGGGTYVADIVGSAVSKPLIGLFARHEEAYIDYMEFRVLLESKAAGLAAERATEYDRQIIRSKFDAMAASHDEDDPNVEAELDADFHHSIAEATHNPMMIFSLRSIFELIRQGVFYNRYVVYLESGGKDRLLEQHRTICDAIVAGDVSAAEKAMSDHLKFIIDFFSDAMRLRQRFETARLRAENYGFDAG
jgi:GntR family transcriptional regulator, transcriptional repressor for pyruvate dehydrogenase complex